MTDEIEVPRVAVNDVFKPKVFELPHRQIGANVLVLPPGFTAAQTERAYEAFEQAQPHPRRRHGTYTAADIDSFLKWMNDNCTVEAPVFARGAECLAESWADPELTLIGIGNYSKKEHAAWHDFSAEYEFPVTKAWTSWTGTHKIWMSQDNFAEFVEAHLYEFAEPQSGEVLSEAVTRMIEALGGTRAVATPNKMYEMGNGIKITVTESVEVALDRATGETTLKFTEEHTGKGSRPVSIPKFFYIRVPIFFGEEPSLVGALLRYRNVGGGKVNWSYELFAPDLVVKAAFEQACAIVKADRTLYLGTPDRP